MKSANTALRLLVVGCVSAMIAVATRIDGVCTAVRESTGIARPHLPRMFRVNVECSMGERNQTIYVREYFDYKANRGRITQHDLLNFNDVFFNYNDNEIIVIDINSKICIVGDLSSADNSWMFGYRTGAQGMPHIFGASGALHFGDSPEEYIGKTTVRGISVNQWDSCQYSDALNATMKVSWYFSYWDMQLGFHSVPIRATAAGKQYKNGQIVPFNHTYDFFKFEEYIYTQDFEVPIGVVCPGRINAKRFPSIPDRFSFNGEVLSFDKNVVTYLEESYDRKAKINVFHYKSQEDVGFLTSVNRMLQVNDYNSGISYIVDTVQDTCQVSPLGQKGHAFLRSLHNGKVVMKTPAEFFYDENTQYSYVGVRTTRDIPCELWVATTDKVQGYTDRNVTVEWYFAITADGESWNTQEYEWRLPIQFRMWDQRETDAIYEFNIFYYDVTRPSLINADVSVCFSGSHRRRFTFDIDGKDSSAVYDNIEMFKYALTSAVSMRAGISQLRVTDIELYFDVNGIHVSFDLLDKPSIMGDVNNMTRENDLSTAVSMYNDAMASGALHISVSIGSDVKTIRPMPGSSMEIGGQSSGFTTGALAGLGVAMLVVGSAGGVGAAMLLFR